MDRDRLQDIQQTDIMESRVNQDFLEWMKTKGMSWLLIILIALCAYILIVRLKERSTQKHATAWQSLDTASLPSSLEDVANEYSGIFGVPQTARLRAAQMLMSAVQRNEPLSATTDPLDTTPPVATQLTEAERESYLTRTSNLLQAVIDEDDGTKSRTLFTINAFNGMAAVAEARGDIDGAQKYYEKTAARAEDHFPQLVQRARDRAASAADVLNLKPLMTTTELNALRSAAAATARRPVSIDPALNGLIFPAEPVTNPFVDRGP